MKFNLPSIFPPPQRAVGFYNITKIVRCSPDNYDVSEVCEEWEEGFTIQQALH